MQHYLTLLLFSAPCLQSNARGESDGNLVTLQKVSMGGTQRTLLSGLGVRWAIREGFRAVLGEDKVFRHHLDPKTPTGYTYGPKHNPSKKGGLKDLDAAKIDPLAFIDMRLLGDMATESGGDNNDLSVGRYKRRSQLFVGDAISLAEFKGETTFHQGIAPDKEPKKGAKEGAEAKVGDIAPFSVERHFSRYQYRVTVNLDTVSSEDLQALVSVLLNGLQVGGGHARAASEVVPDAVLWSFHNAPGASGLYNPEFQHEDGVLNLTDFFNTAEERGRAIHSAGIFNAPKDAKAPAKLRDVPRVLALQAADFMKEVK